MMMHNISLHQYRGYDQDKNNITLTTQGFQILETLWSYIQLHAYLK